MIDRNWPEMYPNPESQTGRFVCDETPDLLLDDVCHAHRLKPGSQSGVGGPHRKVKISDEIHFAPVKPYGLLDANLDP